MHGPLNVKKAKTKPKNQGTIYFQNTGHHSPTDKASYPSRPKPLNSKLFVYCDDIQSTVNHISTAQADLTIQ